MRGYLQLLRTPARPIGLRSRRRAPSARVPRTRARSANAGPPVTVSALAAAIVHAEPASAIPAPASSGPTTKSDTWATDSNAYACPSRGSVRPSSPCHSRRIAAGRAGALSPAAAAATTTAAPTRS